MNRPDGSLPRRALPVDSKPCCWLEKSAPGGFEAGARTAQISCRCRPDLSLFSGRQFRVSSAIATSPPVLQNERFELSNGVLHTGRLDPSRSLTFYSRLGPKTDGGSCRWNWVATQDGRAMP